MKLERLDDDQIRAIVASQIKSAHSYDSDALSGKRTDNLERYEGEP